MIVATACAAWLVIGVVGCTAPISGLSSLEEKALKPDAPAAGKSRVVQTAAEDAIEESPENTKPDVKTAARIPPGDQDDMLSVDAGTSKLSLEAAVQECLANNLRLRATSENIQKAYADVDSATLLPNPSLLVDSMLQPFPGRPFSPTRQGGPPQYDALVSYPLDWFLFGKRNAQIESARRAIGVSASDVDDFARLQVMQTVIAFYDVLEAQALLKLSENDVENFQQLVTMTQRRIELGGVGTVELDRIRLAMLNSQRDVQLRKSAVIAAKSGLQAALGRTTFDPNFEVDGSLEAPVAAEVLDAESVFELAQQHRPDIESLRRQVQLAEAELQREQTKAKPEVSAMLGYTYQQQQKAIGFPDAQSFNGSVTTSVPLFDRNQGNIRRANTTLLQANIALQSRLVDLRAEVETAVSAYRNARQVVTQTAPAQGEAARNVREKVTKAFEAGDRALIDVLDTQRSYRDTFRLLINSRAEYWKSLHRLNATAGTKVLE